MFPPRIEKPDLPEYMTWEEPERLPEEVVGEIGRRVYQFSRDRDGE
ncbi:hypothetical protein [Nocardia rhamnosiphila]